MEAAKHLLWSHSWRRQLRGLLCKSLSPLLPHTQIHTLLSSSCVYLIGQWTLINARYKLKVVSLPFSNMQKLIRYSPAGQRAKSVIAILPTVFWTCFTFIFLALLFLSHHISLPTSIHPYIHQSTRTNQLPINLTIILWEAMQAEHVEPADWKVKTQYLLTLRWQSYPTAWDISFYITDKKRWRFEYTRAGSLAHFLPLGPLRHLPTTWSGSLQASVLCFAVLGFCNSFNQLEEHICNWLGYRMGPLFSSTRLFFVIFWAALAFPAVGSAVLKWPTPKPTFFTWIPCCPLVPVEGNSAFIPTLE